MAKKLDFETLYNKLCSASSTFERVELGKKLIQLFQENEEVQRLWNYHPEELLWIDRFSKKDNELSFRDVPTYFDNDTYLRQAPSVSGLYFYGNTAFNPHTNEVQFWVKIGMSTNLLSRAKSYCTSSPSTYVIGYKVTNNCYLEEREYQKRLSQVALYKNQNNTEWWMVDKDTYLKMCEKKFDFFKKTP